MGEITSHCEHNPIMHRIPLDISLCIFICLRRVLIGNKFRIPFQIEFKLVGHRVSSAAGPTCNFYCNIKWMTEPQKARTETNKGQVVCWKSGTHKCKLWTSEIIIKVHCSSWLWSDTIILRSRFISNRNEHILMIIKTKSISIKLNYSPCGCNRSAVAICGLYRSPG